MSRTWVCATEAAVRSQSADFDFGQKACGAMAQAVDDAGSALSADAGNGWSGIEGDYAVGLQAVARFAAAQVSDFAAQASEVEACHRRAAETIEQLESTSDALLNTAEEAQVSYTHAETGAANSWLAANAHIRRRSQYDEDSAEWAYANNAFWQSVGSAQEFESLRDAKAEELDELQSKFDQLRTDEDDAHQQFADQMLAVDLTADPIQVDASGVAAAPLGLVFDALDAAAVGVPVRSHSPSGRARSSAVRNARRLLADMTNSDLEVRDERVETVKFTQRLRRMGPDAFAEGFVEAVEGSDVRRARRQSELLLRGFGAMAPREVATYLDVLTISDEFTAYALHEVPAHPAIIDRLMRLGEGGALYGMTNAQSRLFLDLFGEDNDRDFNALVSQKVYEDILGQDNGYGRILSGLEGQYGLVSPHVSRELGGALRTHLVANPALLAELSLDLDREPMQAMLDVIDRSNPTEREWADLVGARISGYPFEKYFRDGGTLDSAEVWQNFGTAVGTLRAQIDSVHGGSYDASGVVRFVLKTGLGEIPAVGSFAKKAYEGLDALVRGYEANDVDRRIDTELEQDMARHVLAMAAVAQADPAAAEELVSLLDEMQPGQELDVINRLLASESDLSVRVSNIAQEIESAETDALDGG